VSFKAVLFDLFDTLVLFDRNRLPELQINGRMVRSTAGHLFPILAPYAPGMTLAQFYEALLASWQEAERIRATDSREVSAPERFGFLFRHLGLTPSTLPREVLQGLLATHKRELSRAAEFPAAHRSLLARLASRFRLGVVSNFDYAPTARWILEREGIGDLFDAVVISEEVGWRKPKPIIFEVALARLQILPVEALFVGDRADIDVLGAKRAGLAAAWLNRAGEPLPQGIPTPEYEIRDLGALGTLLGV
jgi:HAD superfamily hydrolase (TIGR01549 family)